ncbi:MAG: electron transfer flavoprotein subunit beta/FixA family protein [Oscillospiraceae bacterium]|nr:electron transfer flavoprotein subunit beta/FixA family protein [Oscillospiraceae bacterium]
MKILVCMKAVPSTGQVQVDGQFRLQRDGAKLQWNIADEAALEAALTLKSAEDTVTVLTMGPAKLEDPLRELLARGADRAILVSDPAFAGADTVATAGTIAKAAEFLGDFDLILCGRRAIDGETGQTPAMVAAALGIPCISNAESVQLQNGAVFVARRLESGTVLLSVPCPVCVSMCEYTYTLRLPGIMGMRRAKSKTVELLDSAALGLSPQSCGLKGSLTKVISMDSKFPGLRNGPKETDLNAGTDALLAMLQEVVK